MTQALAKTILTVKYVNPPPEGGTRGTIKSEDDEYFGVWTDKMDLDSFQVGETYHVEYSDSKAKNGRVYRNIKSAVAAASGSELQRVAVSGNEFSPITEAERALVIALRRILAELKGM